jgi:hypothetical protein
LKRDTRLSAATSSSSSSSSTWAKWSMIRQVKFGIALILDTARTPDPHWHGSSLAMTPMTTQQPACCCIRGRICRLHRCCCIWPQLYELIDLVARKPRLEGCSPVFVHSQALLGSSQKAWLLGAAHTAAHAASLARVQRQA